MKKVNRIVSILITAGLLIFPGTAQAAEAGDLDATWGNQGFSEAAQLPLGVQTAIASDGSVYYASVADSFEPTAAAGVVRYTADGKLDPAFGQVDLGLTASPRVAIQPAGDSYAVLATEGSQLIRLASTGQRDAAFNPYRPAGGSKVTFHDVESSSSGDRIAVLARAGEAGGSTSSVPMPCGWPCPYIGAGARGGASQTTLTVLGRDGSPDPMFAGGVIPINPGPVSGFGHGPCAVVVCVMAGGATTDEGTIYACVTLLCGTSAPRPADFSAKDVALDPTGGVYIAGTITSAPGVSTPAIVHLLSDGTPDGSFGTRGILLGEGAWAKGRASTVTVDRDGNLLVTLQHCSTHCATSVIRLKNGRLDPDFGGGAPVEVSTTWIPSTVVENTNRTLVVLVPGDGVVRLTPAGLRDETFGTSGKVDTPSSRGTGAVDASGRVYVPTQQDSMNRIMRFLGGSTDGSTIPDPDPEVALTGKVTDSRTKAGIAGGTVECGGITTTTASTGDFTLKLVPGAYHCTASAPGYASKKVRVTVGESGGTADFELRPL